NLNHNTLTINRQRHNVNGKATIIETFDSDLERGAKLDLTPALNLSNELKSATRKAVIKDGSRMTIEDVLETNASSVTLRWNMVTPATATIVDGNTIRLTQEGKTLLLEFGSDVPVTLVIRPSENPSQYKSEFGNYNYGSYNQTNPGTVMVGFDATMPANTKVKFTVDFIEAI